MKEQLSFMEVKRRKRESVNKFLQFAKNCPKHSFIEKQKRLAQEWEKGTPLHGEELKLGDVFMTLWTGRPYRQLQKGIVTSVDEVMASYKPTSDCLGDFGFGCTHRIVNDGFFKETRLIKGQDMGEYKKVTYVAAMPNLYKNPGFDLINL